MNFWERYEKVCKERGVKPMAQDTADRFNSTRASIASWKTKGIVPKGETIAMIASSFQVSSDYLLGLTNEPTEYKTSKRVKNIMPKALRMYYALDAIDQEKVEAYMEGMLSSDKYESVDD